MYILCIETTVAFYDHIQGIREQYKSTLCLHHSCLCVLVLLNAVSCHPQCEVKLAQKRGRLESNLGEDGGDSDSDEEPSAKARYFGYVKQGLYYVTEMERFAPPRKRSRAVVKNYRLVSLRSTTPEELYQRKVGIVRGARPCSRAPQDARFTSFSAASRWE